MKVGVVGLGGQATSDHLPAIAQSDNIELVGVCDSDPTIAQRYASEFGVPGYTTHQELLATPGVDFIIVTVPHGAHREVVESAILAGVHVLKEKPFAINYEDATHLARLSKERDVQVMTALQRRFSPTYRSFFELAAQIGDPFAIDVQYTLNIARPDVGWRGQRAIAGGGCLIDMGYHMLDLLLWYVGQPDRVAASISTNAVPDRDYDAEDTANVLMTWNSGLHGTMRISRSMPPKTERFRISATEGIVEIERGVIRRFDQSGKLLDELWRQPSWEESAAAQLVHFCEVIRGNKVNDSSPEKHVEHLAFIDAAYRAAATGMTVEIQGVKV